MENKEKIVLNILKSEIDKLYESKDLDSLAHIVSFKTILSNLEQEKVITLDESYQLEVHLFGILNLVKSIRSK